MFVHLHVHSHYSILDGMSTIPGLVDKAVSLGMPAIALTDHGNMFGMKEFLDYANKKNAKVKGEIAELEKELAALTAENDPEKNEFFIGDKQKKIAALQRKKIKPIVGCEVYVARRTRHDKDKNVKEDAGGYHLILLAKNKTGYHHLCKMVSLAWIEGRYHRPRIDRELLEQYHEGIIACSACLGGEVHKKLEANKLQEAEDTVLWYKNLFGDDYYLEFQLHPPGKPGGSTDTYEKQRVQNVELLKLARKTDTKIVATNDVHFVEEAHSEAHDLLICLSTGKDVDDPHRMRYTKQEWLKSEQEMSKLFHDLPEALENTLEVAQKVEEYSIDSNAIMPMFPIPEDFGTEQAYREKFTEEDLRKEFGDRFDKLGGAEKVYRIKLESDYLTRLAFEGADQRYGEALTPEIKDRIQFELDTMKTMGFPGYFLIVHDFIAAARAMGVSVGPGRGSAAGSVVAYCLKITDMDPLKYDLLFERFLNPDRISMPDIDIDFDDDGRGKVLDYVTQKYGKDKVAHIITFGTMATKSSIKDVARVLKLPLSESEKLAKLVPQKFPEGKDGKSPKVNVHNCLELVPELKDAYKSNNPVLIDTLKYAELLEGTVRQTGVHACGVIIGADNLTNYIPLATADDKESKEKFLVTQYEGSLVENVGLIKMDFLGLTTLSIIKEALVNIKLSKGIEVDIDHIPLDDVPTYELFSRGLTVGIFQFESPGMKKHLKDLKPTQFEDLIAMNALYRPGPIQYIPQFIKRKHGQEPIVYPFPEMEKRLKETYGIPVFQEQVMLLSRDLAGFTRGQSDELRKAMGKKLLDKMASLREKFLTGAQKNGINDIETLEKIWEDWTEFAKYAFNKSHATCYSWLAYQTGYLKTHHPAEFMAAVLSRSLSDITAITKLMDECKTLKINVLSPDVNESNLTFTVNKNGDIRFGLAAVKGVGANISQAIVDEREQGGEYTSVFDFVERIKSQNLNKKIIEALVGSGAFDSLNVARPSFFVEKENGGSFSDELLRYGALVQQGANSSQQSLFGGEADVIQKPKMPLVTDFNRLEFLNRERDLTGVYISSHPLDEFKMVIKAFTNTPVSELQDLKSLKRKEIVVAGKVTKKQELTSKKGNAYGRIVIEDYFGSWEWVLFGKDFAENYTKFQVDRDYMIWAILQERKSYGNLGLSPDAPKELELKVKKIATLEEMKKRGVRSIALHLPIEVVDDDFTRELLSIIDSDEEPAQPKVDLLVHLYHEGMKVDCKATKRKALCSEELLNYMESKEIRYKIG